MNELPAGTVVVSRVDRSDWPHLRRGTTMTVIGRTSGPYWWVLPDAHRGLRTNWCEECRTDTRSYKEVGVNVAFALMSHEFEPWTVMEGVTLDEV